MKRLVPAVSVLLVALTVPVMAQEKQEQQGEFTPASLALEGMELTASEEAKTHFMQGQHALDMGRVEEAREHLEAAIEADPDFALAHLNLAFTSNNLEEFKSRLERASQKATNASEPVRLMIEAEMQSFRGEEAAELETAHRLTQVQPSSARAWMRLAQAQSGMGEVEEARQSLMRAAEANPNFAPVHMVLANSYLFAEPVDAEEAQKHAEKAVELAPNEAVPHDILGDTYRAQGQFDRAAEAYTEVAELDPDNGSGYQQRGHVHSFLGDFEKARSDYDRAIELEQGNNQAASFGVYRALTHVHQGNPEAAVEELQQHVEEIDGMGVPNPAGTKIFTLNTLIAIALHHDMLDEAQQAMQQRNRLILRQAELAGTEAASRNAEATVAVGEGWLAARKGEFEKARQQAEKAKGILEPGSDPERYQPVHELLGFVDLQQENYEGAIEHLAQGDEDDIYVNFLHAKALEKAGEEEAATRLYEKIAHWNFNSAALALVRAEAESKVQG